MGRTISEILVVPGTSANVPPCAALPSCGSRPALLALGCRQPAVKDSRERPGPPNQAPTAALLAWAPAAACNHRPLARTCLPPGGSRAIQYRATRPWPGAAPACADRPGNHPQLLHHRPHRPRQVDPGRPDAAAHRRGRGPPDAGAVPGPDGHRARARHHHQEPGGAAAVARRRRPGLRAEPDRHPRPRRLHLRGVPVAGRLRGRHPAGRRGPGHRGPDPGQPVPGPGRRPAPDPGAEQDRPARRPAGEVRRRAGRHHRLRAVGRAAGLGQDRRRRGRPAARGGRARSRRRRATRPRPPGR